MNYSIITEPFEHKCDGIAPMGKSKLFLNGELVYIMSHAACMNPGEVQDVMTLLYNARLERMKSSH